MPDKVTPPSAAQVWASLIERVGMPLALLGACVALAASGHDVLAASSLGAATAYLRLPGAKGGDLPPGTGPALALIGGTVATALGGA
jgi:hypothetical protein